MKNLEHSQEIALYLERLRSLRNITMETFLHGIISERQYRRYLNGDAPITFIVLDSLATKLGFDAESIIMEVETETIKQTEKVTELYNFVIKRDTKNAATIIAEINENPLTSKNDILLYKHSLNIYDYLKGNISQEDVITKTKELLDFENILKKRALATSELLILVSFFYFDTFKDIHLIAEKLASYIENNVLIVSGNNIRVLALVLEELSRYFSIKENYEKMFYYANQGINYSNKMRSTYLLDNLYYFAAAASHELKNYNERDILLTKLLGILIESNNDDKLKLFKNRLQEHFDVNAKELVLKKFNNL